MLSWAKGAWPWLAVGAAAGVASQWLWLADHQWEDAWLRLGLGLALGTAVLGGLLALAAARARQAAREAPAKLGRLARWAGRIAWQLSGLGSWNGRLVWAAMLAAAVVAGVWVGYYWRWLPQTGSELIRAYHLKHQAAEGGGLSAYLYPDPAMAAKARELGVANKWDLPDAAAMPGGLERFFVLRWLGVWHAPRDGEYELGGVVDDGLMILVDGKTVAADWKEAPPREAAGRVRLTAGPHALEVRYSQLAGGASLRLFWRGPGGQRASLATARLSPLRPGTPLAPLTRIRLEHAMDPGPGSTYPPFIGGRFWRHAWYGLQ